jgi:hypothetical protein
MGNSLSLCGLSERNQSLNERNIDRRLVIPIPIIRRPVSQPASTKYLFRIKKGFERVLKVKTAFHLSTKLLTVKRCRMQLQLYHADQH